MKLTVTRLLETSKYLATEVGQAIPEFFDYMAEFAEQTVRALRSGLTFSDNFDCEVKTLKLKHNVPQVVSSSKTVFGMLPVRVISKTYGLESFLWFYDDRGQLTVRCGFTGPPADSIEVVIVILF